MVDAHPRHERLGLGVPETYERLLGPAHRTVGRLLGLDLAPLLGVIAGLGQRARALDHVLGRLHDDVTGRVEARPPGASGDLVKLARLEQPVAGAVVLGQAGEEDRPNRDVDPDPERVGAADHLQQAGLGELLDQPAIARQHAGVMHPDPAAHEPGQRAPEAGGEPEAADHLTDRVALLTGAELGRQQRLRPLHRGGLREMHDVDRRPVDRDELLEQLMQRLDRPRVRQRDGPVGVVDQDRLARGAPRQIGGDRADVAQRGRHQQKLRRGQAQQRHLPRPPALAVGVVVKLVHHDLADNGARALPQRDVRQHLGRAAHDRRAGVDRRVTGQHPDVLGAERRAQREELLRHQRLDRRRVIARAALRQRSEVRGHGHQRLPRPRRRAKHDVVIAEHLDHRLFLMRVERQPLARDPGGERGVDRVRVRVGG